MADRPDPFLVPLTGLGRGMRASVHSVTDVGGDDPVARRLLELGFDEGIEVELLHHGPLGGNPLAVRVGTTTVALRRAEAERVRLIYRP